MAMQLKAKDGCEGSAICSCSAKEVNEEAVPMRCTCNCVGYRVHDQGLAISYKLACLMHGNMWVESEEGTVGHNMSLLSRHNASAMPVHSLTPLLCTRRISMLMFDSLCLSSVLICSACCGFGYQLKSYPADVNALY